MKTEKQLYEVTYQKTDWIYSTSIVMAEKKEDIFKFYENKNKKVLDITPCSESLQESKRKGKAIIEIEATETEETENKKNQKETLCSNSATNQDLTNENSTKVKTRQKSWGIADNENIIALAKIIANSIVIRKEIIAEECAERTSPKEKAVIFNIAVRALTAISASDDAVELQAICDKSIIELRKAIRYCNAYRTISLPLKIVIKRWKH